MISENMNKRNVHSKIMKKTEDLQGSLLRETLEIL